MKGVLFDFWGTLVSNALRPSPSRQVRYILRLRMPFQEFIVKFEDIFMTKDYNDLYEAFEAVCHGFKIAPEKDLLDQLVGMWNKNDMLCKPFDETIKVLEELKKNHKLAIVSNTAPSAKRVIEKFDLEKYFDGIYLSCDHGKLKTNPKLFEIALKELKLKKEEVIMVGDAIETDIKGAEKAGIKAVLVDRWTPRDFEPRIENLEELKVHLK